MTLTPQQAALLAALPTYVAPRSRTAANLVARGLARWLKAQGRYKRGLTITPAGREALSRYPHPQPSAQGLVGPGRLAAQFRSLA